MAKKLFFLSLLLVAGIVFFIGCSKVTDNVDPSIFGGTWRGTLTCVTIGPSYDSVTISMSGSTATITGITGSGSCAKTATFTGTLENDHLVFSPQLNTDGCGNSNSFSGSVYENNGTLTMSESISGPNLTTTCSFTGTK